MMMHNLQTKNPSFYLTSFKFSDKNAVIHFYRANDDTMQKWVDYVDSIERDVDGSMISFKHGTAKIDNHSSDVWFVGSKECCESNLEAMIKINEVGDFIFAQIVTYDESSSDKYFQSISKKFYEIIESIHHI